MSRRSGQGIRGGPPRQMVDGVPFAPSDIPGLVSWYVADDASTLTLNDPQWASPTDMSTGSWTANQCTVTPGGVGPLGALDANTITDNGVSARHGVSQTIGTSDGYTAITVSAKMGTARYLIISNTTTIWGAFDLQTGATASSQNSGTRTITSLGDGWYDCYMEMQSTSNSFNLGLNTSNNNNAYVGTGSTIELANPRIVRRNVEQWNDLQSAVWISYNPP